MVRVNIQSLVGLGFIVLLVSCSQPDHIGAAPEGSRPVISISEALRSENYGRTVVIVGKVGEVCQDEGCWMTISDGTAELKMKFRDKSLGVPLNLHGSVKAQGVVRENIVGTSRVAEMSLDGVQFLKGN